MTGTGNLKGTDGGELGGRPGGSTREQGGMDAPNATTSGKGTAAHGMKGGTGPNSAQGIPAGGGIIPLITVPASLRHLTNNLLILKDANPGLLASNWMAKIGTRTSVHRLRKKLKTSASNYAANRLESFRSTIDATLQNFTRQQRETLYRQWFWEIERQYFARVEKGAAAKLAQTGLSKAEKKQAQKLVEAARVKPIAGQLPRNNEHAGQWLPRRKLPRGYKTKGLRFTDEGYPDFGPYALDLPNGGTSVRINMTGSYKQDFKLANKAAGLPQGPPKGYTWHHVEDGTTMMLVPKKLHSHVRHSGGRAAYRHRTGDLSAYPD